MSLLQADCLEVSRFNRFPHEVVQFSSCPHFPSHNSGHQSSPEIDDNVHFISGFSFVFKCCAFRPTVTIALSLRHRQDVLDRRGTF